MINIFKKKINISDVCYDSIHSISIHLFDKIDKSGDFKLLIKPGKRYKGDLEKVWEKIYDEYLNEFGISNKYKDYINLKIAQAELITDHRVNGNKVSKTLAKVKEQEAKTLMESVGESSLSDMAAKLSKNMGFMVDPHTVSVYMFISYLKLAARGEDKA